MNWLQRLFSKKKSSKEKVGRGRSYHVGRKTDEEIWLSSFSSAHSEDSPTPNHNDSFAGFDGGSFGGGGASDSWSDSSDSGSSDSGSSDSGGCDGGSSGGD